MTNKTEKAWKYGQMEPSMKGITYQVKRMDMENCSLQILHFMRGNSKTMKSKEQGNMYGQIKGSTQENGHRVKCMVMERLFGKMEEVMKDSI